MAHVQLNRRLQPEVAEPGAASAAELGAGRATGGGIPEMTAVGVAPPELRLQVIVAKAPVGRRGDTAVHTGGRKRGQDLPSVADVGGHAGILVGGKTIGRSHAIPSSLRRGSRETKP